jgi:hypothetical protein
VVVALAAGVGVGQGGGAPSSEGSEGMRSCGAEDVRAGVGLAVGVASAVVVRLGRDCGGGVGVRVVLV